MAVIRYRNANEDEEAVILKRLIIGISAADGVSIGVHILTLLREMPEVETHLVLSRAARRNLRLECGTDPARVQNMASFCYEPDDMAALIASGSFLTDGMIVAPCSMKTLAGIVHGHSDNLLLRAADVCLKEGRRVVLIPRETPLSLIHLRNLTAAAEAGCMIVPPMLTFYSRPDGISGQMDHIAGKALMPFGLVPSRFRVWEGVREEHISENQ